MDEHKRASAVITVSVAEAKARFSELLKKAAAGAEIHVTKHGNSYVKLGPDLPEKPKLPRLGAFEHVELHMPDDWDELGPEWDPYVK